jgi:hypothetical protein
MPKFEPNFFVLTPRGRCEIFTLTHTAGEKLSYKFSGMEVETAEFQLDQEGEPYVIIEDNVYYIKNFRSTNL